MHNVYETLKDFYDLECMEADIDMSLTFGNLFSVVRLSCKSSTGDMIAIHVCIDFAKENVKEFLLDELEFTLLKLKEHRKAKK